MSEDIRDVILNKKEVLRMETQEQDKDSRWETIEPGVWKPANEGDQIQGILVQKREKGGKYDSESYVVENQDGMHLIFATTVLQQRMELVNVGDEVRITYKGVEQNTKGQDVKIFKVQRAKATAAA
jgi:hypothetical protein